MSTASHTPASGPQTSPGPPTGDGTARRRPWWKKLVFACVATVGFFMLLELVLTAAGVQPVNSLEDPYVGFASYSPLFVEKTDARGRAVMATAENKSTWFNPQEFPPTKPDGTYRIFTLGGSTTYGRPYNDTTSFSGWLREFLPEADASHRWSVVNAGGISYASYRVARLMEELNDYEPDLYIVYCGHNEFLERRTYSDLIDTPEALRDLQSALGKSRTYSLLRRLLRGGEQARHKPGDGMQAKLPEDVDSILDDAVGPDAYTRDDEFRRQVIAHYRFNLGRMIRLARSAGARVILVVPASNLRNCSPFKSDPQAGMDEVQRVRLEELVEGTQQLMQAGRWRQALATADEALAIDRRFARLQYLRGRILWQFGGHKQARKAFLRARDEDVCPLRALSEMVAIVRDVAAEQNVPLLDFERLIEKRSPGEVPGEEWFLDHVHPTIAGHRLLAEQLLELMRSEGLVASPLSGGARQRVIARVESRIDRRAHAVALKNLSKVLGWAGKQEESQKLALRAVAMIPDDAEAQFEAGNACLQLRRYDDAIRYFRTSLKLLPGSAKAFYGIGLAYELQQRPEKAIEQFRAALEHDPGFANAHFKLGRLYADANRIELAERHYRLALKLNPHDHLSRNGLGILLARRGERDAAEREFRRALRDRPGFADALCNLGRIQRERGEERQAVQSFREALRGDPGHYFAACQLADLLATSPDDGLRDGKRAVFWAGRLARQTNYRDAAVLSLLAAAFAETGDFARAVKAQQAAIDLTPAARRPPLQARLRNFRNSQPLRHPVGPRK